MLKLIGKKVYPIGVDLGSSCLKMVQLMDVDGGLGLVAAAKVDVPGYLSGHHTALLEWYLKTIKEVLTEKPFKGRKVASSLAARDMLIQHLRVAKMGPEELAKALPWEAQGKVPFDIHQAMLRHIVAGEVYEGDDSKYEVILMAASNQVINQHLHLLERAKFQISEVNVEPCALINCFAHLLQKADKGPQATMFVDMGHHSSKVVITQGDQIVFCRSVSIAAEHFRKVLSDQLEVDYEETGKTLVDMNFTSAPPIQRSEPVLEQARPKISVAQRQEGQSESGEATTSATATLDSTERKRPDHPANAATAVEPTLNNLSEELRSCVRYHDLMFPGAPLARVIFLGGLARNKSLCQRLAQGLRLPAQLGDPVARVDPTTRFGPHSDLESGQFCSDWAVAFGLSLGGSH